MPEHEHDWAILKVESYSEMTLRYRCSICQTEIVHPAIEPAPPRKKSDAT